MVAHRHLRGAAQAQERHFVQAFVQRIHAAEVGQQHGGGLAADTTDAGNVVHRIAAQRQVIGDLVRMHAMPRLDAGHVPALVARVVPLLVVIEQQLRQVLVGGNDHATMAVPVLVQGTADQCTNWRLSASGAGSRLAL
ncbi:hypothetical protein G6F40_014636 [Rhizopus arrhizus]|nr:hypothetical protein G6F40_014636 [Rhizopus arrhizus]